MIAMSEKEFNKEELELAPLDPETEAVREMNLARYGPVTEPVEEPVEPKYQFGIGHILLTTFIIAVCLAALEWFPVQIVAGILGSITFVFLVAILRLGREFPKLRMLWVVLLFVYTSVAIYVAVRFV